MRTNSLTGLQEGRRLLADDRDREKNVSSKLTARLYDCCPFQKSGTDRSGFGSMLVLAIVQLEGSQVKIDDIFECRMISDEPPN